MAVATRQFVIPAKAGIQGHWTPALAGVTRYPVAYPAALFLPGAASFCFRYGLRYWPV